MSAIEIKRRLGSALAACVVVACASCSSSPAAGPIADGGLDGMGSAGADAKLTGGRFVLVNGAFLGAWSWSAVKAGLESRGAQVTAVELPAHGDDMTPVSGATLDSYVAAVSAAIDAAGGKVTLVGHSMGGMVISQVAEAKPDSIDKLVYVAAFLPKDGDTLQALALTDPGSHLGPATVLNADGTASVPIDKLNDIFCLDCSQPEQATLQSHYRNEPIMPLVTPVHTSVARWGRLPKYYVFTTMDNAISPSSQQAMTSGVSLVATASLASSHAPFLAHPEELVSALVSF